MGYIKNAALLFFLSYCYSITNSKSKENLRQIIRSNLKKYEKEINDIVDFLDTTVDSNINLQENQVDFILKKKCKKMFTSIQKINTKSIEKDINSIKVDNIVANNKKGNKNVR